MIAKISGKIVKQLPDSLIVDTGPIGFKVFVTVDSLNDLREGEEVELFTHLQVREDALELYGFFDFEQLIVFEQLICVSGVGPKMALRILSAAKVEEIKEAILKGDTDLFTAVSGIGKKSAARIVVDLKSKLGKLEKEDLVRLGKPEETNEVIEALRSLGYSVKEAHQVLRKVDKNLNVEEKIKEALRALGR